MTLVRILNAAIRSMARGTKQPHCYHAHIPGKGYTNDGTIPELQGDYLRQLRRECESERDNLGYAPSYAEKGYISPKNGVIWTNWNVFPTALQDILERAKFAVEWSDEWTNCADCGRAVRTEPDCWFWQPAWSIVESDLLCVDCLHDWALSHDWTEETEA